MEENDFQVLADCAESNGLYGFERNYTIDPQKLPEFDNEIFDSLPDFAKTFLGNIADVKSKQTAFFGLLSFASGAFPKVKAFYADTYIEANIFGFLLGYSGSGKSKLALPKKLFNRIHAEKIKDFKIRLREYKVRVKENPDEDNGEPPVQELFFIPANNSKTGLIELLTNSSGRGVFYESESDTLSDAIKSEHGNFTDILRKVFHHEPISYYRRGGKERVELEEPYLSILLAGTYDQVSNIFSNTANGLFNRFVFYNLQQDVNFSDVFNQKNNSSFDTTCDLLSGQIWDTYQYLFQQSDNIIFKLNESQQNVFNSFFNEQKDELRRALGKEDCSISHRWAIITFKVMMLLTILRNLKTLKDVKEITCSDEDFINSIRIFSVLREHFLYVYQMLLLSKKSFIKYDESVINRIRTLKSQGSTYRDIARIMDIPLSTIYRWCKP